MASLVLRCILLVAFVYGNLQAVSWYAGIGRHHQDVAVLHAKDLLHTATDSSGTDQERESACNTSSPSLADENEVGSCHQNLLVDSATFRSRPLECLDPTQRDHSPSDTDTFSLNKSDLLWISCVLVNALTILDLVLSRRTKPWRFFLRILYRISRSNFKWAILCLTCHLWFQLGGGRLTDMLVEAASRQPVVRSPGLQMQQIWFTLQSYPVLSTLSFVVYNLMVGWILHRLMPRNAPAVDTGSINNNRGNNGRPRIQSRWSLLVECLFRPVSFATAHNLTDFDFELDDSMELLIERLALPNLWLTPIVPNDYLKYLPVWQFNGWSGDTAEGSPSAAELSSSSADAVAVILPKQGSASALVPTCSSSSNADQPPSCMIPSSECAICLDKYRCTVDVCGLPCGHHFHHGCISTWLQRDNHHCPICRWPAYRNKCLSTI